MDCEFTGDSTEGNDTAPGHRGMHSGLWTCQGANLGPPVAGDFYPGNIQGAIELQCPKVCPATHYLIPLGKRLKYFLN